MKNIKKICFVVLALATIASCSYEPEIGSTETNFPILTIAGDAIFVTTKGTPYTDQGATAKEGSTTIAVTATGADKVNTNTIGVYKITYAAVNKDGYDASAIRTIIVTDNKPSAIDLTGTWLRNGTNKNVITRISDRKYTCDNATGYINGDPNNLAMTFYNLDDVKIYAPYQENCSLTGIDAESNIGTIVSSTRFNWVLFASGFFGTAQRNFVKS